MIIILDNVSYVVGKRYLCRLEFWVTARRRGISELIKTISLRLPELIVSINAANWLLRFDPFMILSHIINFVLVQMVNFEHAAYLRFRDHLLKLVGFSTVFGLVVNLLTLAWPPPLEAIASFIRVDINLSGYIQSNN